MVVEVLWCPNGGRLVVELPDHGALIRCELATDTFVEVIKRIGIERVRSLDIEIAGIPLISTTEYPNRRQYHVGEYYITGGLSPRGHGKETWANCWASQYNPVCRTVSVGCNKRICVRCNYLTFGVAVKVCLPRFRAVGNIL